MTPQTKDNAPKAERSITAILMGGSGTGKTSLAYPFVKAAGAAAIVIQSSASRGFKFLPVKSFSPSSVAELASLLNRAAKAPGVRVVVLDDFDYICRELVRKSGAQDLAKATQTFLLPVEPALYALFASGKSVFLTMKAVPSQTKDGTNTVTHWAPFLGPVTGKIVDGLVDVVAHCFAQGSRRFAITQPEQTTVGKATSTFFAKCRVGLALPPKFNLEKFDPANGCPSFRDELVKAFAKLDNAEPSIDPLAGVPDEPLITDSATDDGFDQAQQLALGGE